MHPNKNHVACWQAERDTGMRFRPYHRTVCAPNLEVKSHGGKI